MSTETANVVSLPIADDDQKHEKIVKEEDHAAEKCDTLPSKNDAEKHEKGNYEAENSEGTETSISKFEETQVINHTKPPVALVVEKVQNSEADHECKHLELVENVPETNEVLEKAQTTESEVENEAEKTEHIEAVANELETMQAGEACEKIEVENIAIGNESETQATEKCEAKEAEAITIEAAETESAKADEDKQEETAVIEEQKDEMAKDVAVENVESEKKTSTDEGKTNTCELATNEESQTAEKEAEKSADSTNELQNAADQVKDRDLVEGSVKQDEYKDIKEAKVSDSKAEAIPSLEPSKDGEPEAETEAETEASKDQVVDVSAKTTQKQSGNGIISKVKQSLVKVKKAIGKSLSSKALSPEIKEDQENVK